VGEIAAKTGDDPCEAAALLAATLPVKSLTTDENDESDLPVPSHEDGVIARLDLRTALTRLTDGERELIALRYRRNLTQSEVGKALGMTQVQVSRAEKRVLMKLRRWME
jgi:RNA polymerase sporulation-specific sigma factor